MPSRTITGTIYHPGGNTPWAGARVDITLLAPFSVGLTAYAAETHAAITAADGTFSVVLAVPTTGTALYEFRVPNYATFRANIADGATVDLTTLILLTGSSIASTTAAIDAHALIEASTTVLGHVKVDGVTVTAVGGVLSSAGGASTHASTHASIGSDPVTLEQSQITGLAAALATYATTSALTTHAALVTGVHGLINSGAFTLTIPATGTAALLATAQTFTRTQTVDVTAIAGAIGLSVSSLSGNGISVVNTFDNGQSGISVSTVGNVPLFLSVAPSTATNTILPGIIMNGRTNATPVAGFGHRILTRLKSSTTIDQDAGAIDTLWTDATHATRTSAITLSTVSSAGALAERARVDAGAGADTTGLMLWDVNSGTVKRVSVGAADSGGVGFRMLRVAN